MYFATFIGAMIFFVLVVLHTFTMEIRSIENKYKFIQEDYKNLLAQHMDLTNQINAKQEEILLVSDKVEDLEGIVGIDDKAQNLDLLNRVELASITGLQKLFFMKFVPNGYPLENTRRISSNYGYRIHPLSKKREMHTGTDIGAQIGTPVYATADGVVDFAKSGWNGGYGTIVKLDHSFGFKTYYAHLQSSAVQKGEFVKKGQLIAYVGNTGSSSGAHLHYEVRFLGNHINPRNFMDWEMANFGKIFDKEKNVAWHSLLTTINNLINQIPTERQLSQLAANSKAI